MLNVLGTLDPFGGGYVESEALTLLQRHVPVWMEALRDVRAAEGSLPDEVVAIHLELLRVYDATFADLHRPPNAYRNKSNAITSFFPQWPPVRGLERYVADGEKDDGEECAKLARGHPKLSPGIIVYMCTHAVCYGFTIMETPESPRMPFVVFATRWEQPPQRVIYDNACKLHNYCLNREPLLFKNTHFLVDR